MALRISGKSFEVSLGDHLLHVESMSASIEDNSTVVKSGGVPNGHVDGDVGCSGDIELDWENFLLIVEEARSAGSFRRLPEFDIVCYAKAGNTEAKVEQFGCKLKLSDLLDNDPAGGEKSKVKLGFEVTSPDFVRINGVPYLAPEETEDLI